MSPTDLISKISSYLTITDEKERGEFFADLEKSSEKLIELGKDPVQAYSIIESIGKYFAANAGENFTGDYQKFSLGKIILWAVQLPGGGNIYLFETEAGKLIIDTGYGCYFHDAERMLEKIGAGGFSNVKKVLITHADSDHCGASGYLPAAPKMHPVTKKILDAKTRGFNTNPEFAFLEKVYAQTINYLSKQHLSETMEVFNTEPIKHRGIFPVIDKVSFGGMNFEVWESLGGHIAGQIFLYEERLGLLFTSDALMHFGTLTESRKQYCSVADYLVSSVNANSEVAKTERRELMKLANIFDAGLKKHGRKLLVCCGHGDVCVIDEKGMLESAGGLTQYQAAE